MKLVDFDSIKGLFCRKSVYSIKGEKSKENIICGSIDTFRGERGVLLYGVLDMVLWERHIQYIMGPTKKWIALKVIPKKDISEKQILKHTNREKNTLEHLSRKNHPFIVPYYGSFQDQDSILGMDLFKMIQDINGFIVYHENI